MRGEKHLSRLFYEIAKVSRARAQPKQAASALRFSPKFFLECNEGRERTRRKTKAIKSFIKHRRLARTTIAIVLQTGDLACSLHQLLLRTPADTFVSFTRRDH